MPVSLFHRDLGGAGLPPLILLHGLLGSSRNWQTTGAQLASRHHVFALDLRNHGQSPHDELMDYSVMMDDVAAWANAQGMGNFSLMGHSMGGKVAMLFACRQPERIDRLVVVDIAPKNYLSNAHRAEFAAMNELELRGLASRAEAELRFEARVPDWSMRKFLTTNLERDDDGSWKWLVNLPVLTRALPVLEKNPLTAADQFTGPCLFLNGGKSRYVLPEDEPAIRKFFPHASRITLENCGHNPHMEAREAFVAAVLTEPLES